MPRNEFEQHHGARQIGRSPNKVRKDCRMPTYRPRRTGFSNVADKLS